MAAGQGDAKQKNDQAKQFLPAQYFSGQGKDESRQREYGKGGGMLKESVQTSVYQERIGQGHDLSQRQRGLSSQRRLKETFGEAGPDGDTVKLINGKQRNGQWKGFYKAEKRHSAVYRP